LTPTQGIASPVITSATPDLRGWFLRGTSPGSSGTFQQDAFQGHIHNTAAAGDHTHPISTDGAHAHTYNQNVGTVSALHLSTNS